MLTIVGQCRGDLVMFRRQLYQAGLASNVEGKPKFVKPPGPVVILGDLISPLNAWCAFAPTTPSEDAEILKLAVLVSEETGACIVEGLHELLLLGGDTSRCHTGPGHRALLSLVRSPKFLARWAAATRDRCSSVHGVTRACRSVKAILQDNASLPAPSEKLAPYWPAVSAFDRGTRYIHREIEVPQLYWCSRAFGLHPSALCTHLSSIYSRARCGQREWATAVDGVVEQYRAFDDARRSALLVVHGVVVPDEQRGLLGTGSNGTGANGTGANGTGSGSGSEKAAITEALRASLAPIVERYKLEASAASLAAAAAQRVLHKGPKRA